MAESWGATRHARRAADDAPWLGSDRARDTGGRGQKDNAAVPVGNAAEEREREEEKTKSEKRESGKWGSGNEELWRRFVLARPSDYAIGSVDMASMCACCEKEKAKAGSSSAAFASIRTLRMIDIARLQRGMEHSRPIGLVETTTPRESDYTRGKNARAGAGRKLSARKIFESRLNSYGAPWPRRKS